MDEPNKEAVPLRGFSRWGVSSLSLTLIPVIGSIGLGLIVLMLVGVGFTGLLWSLAWLSVGSLLGIVFGIPKQQSRPEAKDSVHSGLRANTNMEEISDWLTKLLVGVGLVELKGLSGALTTAAGYVSLSLPKNARTLEAMQSIAMAMILYFTVEGFIGGYLITRVFFQIAFQRADEAILRETIERDRSQQ